MSRTPYERAEAAKVIARLHFANATVHAQDVHHRFGLFSPEYIVARQVVQATRAKLVEAYDRLIALDKWGAGVPSERIS